MVREARLYTQAVQTPLKPTSRNAFARRLEYVRQAVQCQTLREFWRRLIDGEEYEVSYEAVRNYHSDRDPPVDYLIRVAEVFGVNLEWLATGATEPWPVDAEVETAARGVAERAHPEFESAMEEVFWQYRKLPPLAVAVILKTCDRLYRDAEFRASLQSRTGPTRAYVGRFVGKALAGPLMNAVAGTVRTADLHMWQIESYVVGICQALVALIPNPNWSQQKFMDTAH